MEFGRVTAKELNKIDFSLPREPRANKTTIKKTRKKSRVYLGCAKWGRKEWVGKIYPKGTREAQFLDQYLLHYNSIELNATHYKVYTHAEIKRWAVKADGRDFTFCPKVPNRISHFSGFNPQAGPLMTEFLDGVMAFGEHLGPIFLQVSDKYSPKQKEKLFAYLESLPKHVQFFLEVRHPAWFSDSIIREELFSVLRKCRIGAVITDTAGRRDVVHMELTIPKTFIRFVGNSLHKTDYTRCDEWVTRIKYWLKQGVQEIYFFMHMHDEAFSPELTVYLVDKLNAACKLDLIQPVFVKGALFDQFAKARKRSAK